MKAIRFYFFETSVEGRPGDTFFLPIIPGACRSCSLWMPQAHGSFAPQRSRHLENARIGSSEVAAFRRMSFLTSDDPLVTGKLVYDWNSFSISRLAEKEASHDVADRSRQPPRIPSIFSYQSGVRPGS